MDLPNPVNLNDVRRAPGYPPLNQGGGDGTFGDMEARVKRLEDDGKELRSDLKIIMRDVAEIKGTLTGLPKTWQVVTLNFGVLGVIVATVSILHAFKIV